jgi:ribosome-associated translation inhibitor RaiA
MTQENKLKASIRKKLKEIENNLDAYEKVDATLSKKTLSNVEKCLDLADQALEVGFIADACSEIEEQMN